MLTEKHRNRAQTTVVLNLTPEIAILNEKTIIPKMEIDNMHFRKY
jgi:hypothetical protein